MKANERERNQFDHALDEILELFNHLEDDEPLVHFDQEVMEKLQKAKLKFGASEVDSRINTVCREMLSWLDLDDVVLDNQNDEDEKEQQEK
ncbi:MAG TPA: hypothetical protein VFK37_08760 [Bacillales bacterium]|nr:hypothetical protein [Bacillales bacterium]